MSPKHWIVLVLVILWVHTFYVTVLAKRRTLPQQQSDKEWASLLKGATVLYLFVLICMGWQSLP